MVIALSALICFISYQSEALHLSIFSVFTPSIVALFFTIKTKGRKGVYELIIKQTVQKTRFKWFLLSITGIPLIASLSILTELNFELSKFSLRTTQLMPQLLVIIMIALGEEYGWRGFLLPRLLKRFNLLYSSIILGLIWGLWHFPAYLIGTGVPLQMNFMIFLLWIMLGSLLINWIYYETKSVGTSLLVHISANATFNYLFLLPEFTGNMNTFWIFMLYLSIVVIFVFFLKRKEMLNAKYT